MRPLNENKHPLSTPGFATNSTNGSENANLRCTEGAGCGCRPGRRAKIERANRCGLPRNEFTCATDTIKIGIRRDTRQLDGHGKGKPEKRRKRLYCKGVWRCCAGDAAGDTGETEIHEVYVGSCESSARARCEGDDMQS